LTGIGLYSTATAVLLIATTTERASGQSLTNDLVSHWPLDVVQGTRTPDVVSGYDMNLSVLTAADLVPGHASNCFNFSTHAATLLSRIHAPTDDLPINKHPALTIVLWINAVGTGQSDLRFFSEAKYGGLLTRCSILARTTREPTAAWISIFVRVVRGGRAIC
jgi:hypothetical protein